MKVLSFLLFACCLLLGGFTFVLTESKFNSNEQEFFRGILFLYILFIVAFLGLLTRVVSFMNIPVIHYIYWLILSLMVLSIGLYFWEVGQVIFLGILSTIIGGFFSVFFLFLGLMRGFKDIFPELLKNGTTVLYKNEN